MPVDTGRGMIARRAVLQSGCLVAACLTIPVATGWAQAQPRPRRIGFLGTGGAKPADDLRRALISLGWAEGRDFKMEVRVTGGALAPLDAIARELVALGVDVLAANATPSIIAARKATSTVPIVMMAAGDAPGLGLVEKIARPGGNITGLSLMIVELAGKVVELLLEAAPAGRHFGCLVHEADPLHRPFMAEVARAAGNLGLRFTPAVVTDQAGIEAAFGAMAQAGVTSLVVQPILALTAQEAGKIAALARQHRIAAGGVLKRFAADGGVIAYSAEFDDLGARGARFVDLILRGANPAELPVERPTEFTLALNLRTASAVGVAPPQSLVARADEVIE